MLSVEDVLNDIDLVGMDREVDKVSIRPISPLPL